MTSGRGADRRNRWSDLSRLSFAMLARRDRLSTVGAFLGVSVGWCVREIWGFEEWNGYDELLFGGMKRIDSGLALQSSLWVLGVGLILHSHQSGPPILLIIWVSVALVRS